ncbi:MAG: Bug family tripartite tricarboxylate transporter substrate binding protein [Candidatus Rariloculaceae bacterium]
MLVKYIIKPLLLILFLYASVSASQTAEQFYSGRTVTVLVGSGSGGITDTSARVIAAHIEQEIPGGPTVIVQNMPGGGGVTMTNHLYRSASKDGSVLGYSLPAVVTAQLMEPNRAKYDARELNWIGSAITATNTISITSSLPITTFEDTRDTEVIIGATGRGSLLYQLPAMAKALLGLDLRIITGYQGSAEISLAMERGEVHGQGASLDYWAISRPGWLSNGNLVHLLHIGPADPERAPGVPHLRDLVTSDRDKALVAFLEIGSNIGWPLFAPPEVPAERVDALRAAFMRMFDDPVFLDTFQSSMRTPLRPTMGLELTELVNRAVETPNDIVVTAKDLLGL